MGFGDEIMATGMARGAAARGKLVAFGDGSKPFFGPWSEPIFRHNPNILQPGAPVKGPLEWIAHYKGHRLYNKLGDGRWIWNYDFKAVPGELYFTEQERSAAARVGNDFVLIEPNVPWHKSVAPNKDWGLSNYFDVAMRLKKAGIDVVQFAHGRDHLVGVRVVHTHDFRDAAAILARARVAIVPEGGLHHAAAAVGTKAVVLFGGFIPPQVTGYDAHINLTGGKTEACGSLHACDHCRKAMSNIPIEEVYESALAMYEASSLEKVD